MLYFMSLAVLEGSLLEMMLVSKVSGKLIVISLSFSPLLSLTLSLCLSPFLSLSLCLSLSLSVCTHNSVTFFIGACWHGNLGYCA